MFRPKISIIIPVYKTEAFLHRCVESLLEQTFQNFEILLIDDGSPDKSGVICDEYAKIDNRVQVFHKENGGVSSARNLGLDKARGEWVIFVDSDDYVSHNYLETINNDINKNIDIIFYSYNKISYDGEIISTLKHKEYHFTDGELGTAIRNTKLVEVGYPWSKVFKNEIIQKHNLRFNINLPISEDRLFTYQYLCYVKSLFFSEEIVYNYLIYTEDSLSKKKHNKDLLIYRVEVLYNEMVKIKEKNKLTFMQLYPLLYIHYKFILNVFETINDKNILKKIFEQKRIWNQLKGANFYKSYKGITFNELIEIYKNIGLVYTFLIIQMFSVFQIKSIYNFLKSKIRISIL